MWDAQACIYDNCACALAETFKLRFRATFKSYNFFFLGYILVRIDTDIFAIIECFEAN